MAAQLTQRKNGFIEFASRESIRHEVWHKSGQYLPEHASIEEWQIAAGMDWKINASPVMFHGKSDIVIDDTKRVLFRSDDEMPLGIVSSDYKIVQPGEVLEFFRDLTSLHGMQLSAAGTLFGGKKYWATADVTETEITPGDKVKGQLLFVSSADGSMSTQIRHVSCRTVCFNTLQIALAEKSKNAIKITHAKEFDPTQVKIDMGLIDASWNSFITNLKTLAQKKVTDDFAQNFFAKLITPENSAVDMELLKTQRHVDAMMHFYKKGAGADMTYGNMFGVLNGVTEALTFGTGRRNASAQFDHSENGPGAAMKLQAYNQLVAMV